MEDRRSQTRDRKDNTSKRGTDAATGEIGSKGSGTNNIGPELYGGIGGKGGHGGQTGGDGGLGGAPKVAVELINQFRRIAGGTGGEGGLGDVGAGGRGGTGQGPSIGSLVIAGYRTDLRHLPLTEFCAKYNLSDELVQRLQDLGFKTTRGLFSLGNTDLQPAGFKLGEIAELSGAMSDFALQKN